MVHMVAAILIVEDDPFVRELLSEIMGDECGFEVTAVDTVAHARGLIVADCDGFDLVLLDTRLRDGDGLAFCSELRLGEFDGPIIIMSGDCSRPVQASHLGASAWIQKPFTIASLLEQVEAALLQHWEHTVWAARGGGLRPVPFC